jgi:FMN phosphatase YigB (HAD superfamily)
MKKMDVETIFVDIDTTLTDPKPVEQKEDNISVLIAKKLAEKNNITVENALEKIREAEAKVTEMVEKYWPFGAFDELGLSEEELWDILSSNMKKRLFMHPDAKVFLIGLRQQFPNIKIYTATTNPKLIIFAKLAVEDLATLNGSDYLDGAFGGEEVYPGGKACPEFYTALLDRTGAKADTTLMVGDSPEMDLGLAVQAGIKQVILPRRDQEEDYVYEADGGIYLKNLELALDLIK